MLSVKTSALERLLLTNRVRTGLSVPALHEFAVDSKDGPFLVTLAQRAGFVPTVVRADGTVWAGFKECPLDQEPALVRDLYSALWDTSVGYGWDNRCQSLTEAYAKMVSKGMEPRSVVVPLSLMNEACGKALTLEEAEMMMAYRGYVALVDDVQILVGDLPDQTALLAANMSLAGVYVRARDYLALTIMRADSAWALVGP